MKRTALPRREAVLDVYVLILGAMLLLSPWVMALARGPARADAWVSGAVIVALSAGAILLFAEWEEWIVLACGVCRGASRWLFVLPHPAAMRFDAEIGLLVFSPAAWKFCLIPYD